MKSFHELIRYCYASHNQINFKNCENINLAFLKLLKREIVEQTKTKSKWLESFVKFASFNKNLYQQFIGRIFIMLKELEKQNYKVFFYPFTSRSRLIIGLGSIHPLETSITLHHIFGIPYIPGSALKGVCRMVAFWELAQNFGVIEDERKLQELQKKFYGELVDNNDKNKEILKYQLLFGAQNFKGLLLFLDAYPEISGDGKLFDLDVMNVHYPKYYSGNEPPADWQNPNPIFFLTVKEGILFNFYVLFDEYRFNRLKKDKSELTSVLEDLNIENEVKSLLKQALQNFGIGAKTSLGYGIFQITPDAN